jgi:hypothetical protein
MCDGNHSIEAECPKQQYQCPNKCFSLSELKDKTITLEVGPIWNNNEAALKANAYKAQYPDLDRDYSFNGQWWTTINGSMSAAMFKKNNQVQDKTFNTFTKTELDDHMSQCSMRIVSCDKCMVEMHHHTLESHSCEETLALSMKQLRKDLANNNQASGMISL